MARYAWIITKDLIEAGARAGTIGPWGATPEQEADLKAGKGIGFEMYDDDDEHYYSGLIVGDYNQFEPLDDFGLPNAGCTGIKYWDTFANKYIYI